MKKLLNNRVAVITGAGQGIGLGIAREMAREGACIVVNDYGVGPTGTGQIRGLAEKTAEKIQKEGGDAYSGEFRTVIPMHPGQVFRLMPDTF